MKTQPNPAPPEAAYLRAIQRALLALATLLFVVVLLPLLFLDAERLQQLWEKPVVPVVTGDTTHYWSAPSLETVADTALRSRLAYGRALIMHTSAYLGPRGSVAQLSNGMNCQNCHLEAGTRVFGNNYSAVAATYPKFRARSGGIEQISKRVNDCFERSLNGTALDTNGRELQAIQAYIEFLGTGVQKGQAPPGAGLKDLAFLDRAANPALGKAAYEAKCQSCHQADGLGTFTADGGEYAYPPLWGPHSYNDGAGLFRLSNFAKYIKYNMPLGVRHDAPLLSDEEAWDIAAFVNSQQRPHLDAHADWPDISKKPIDHPFGPYADAYSEIQHKYGPFGPMRKK